MKRSCFLLLLFAGVLSCNHHAGKNNSETIPETDSVVQLAPIDTLALTLDALRNKPLQTGYKMIGDVRTAILTYADFRMGDAATYVFKNETGDEIAFNGNDTKFLLTVKSIEPTIENGGKDPNPVLLNKKYRVVWRRIQLNHKPQNEMELYYQEYDEIIYLKEM